MPLLDIAQARRLLMSRSELIASGITDRELAARLRAGSIRRVRRGWYVRSEDWNAQWGEGRHLIEVVAAHQNSEPPGPLFVGVSAAVLHGLPIYRHVPIRPHALIEHRGHTSGRVGIHWHDLAFDDADITAIDGIRCSSLTRTVLDVASSLHLEGAVTTTDAALRRCAVIDGRTQDEELAGVWRDDLLRRADAVSTRGIRQARRVIEFADGRAESPGESVSRVQLDRIGFRQFDLQMPVVGPDGRTFWMDFAFRRSRCFGEFDGKSKYTDPEFARGRTSTEVLFDEKDREDSVRGVTGWRVGRWGAEHIKTPDALAARLRAFGITPP
ncbi:MAG: type IV toxin-antitoxin system AbiEi family antitoxin domain-containing protein [Microbacterium sp.]